MSCCADAVPPGGARAAARDDVLAAVEAKSGRFHLDIHVPDIACAACIGRIERALDRLEGLDRARVNFGAKRVALDWTDPAFDPTAALTILSDLGYPATPFRITADEGFDRRGAMLLRATAVAGFAAMNVMLLAVAVWAGADAETKAFLHWFAALIALPAVVYAGRPFFTSAFGALRRGTLNMDVPISLGVILASALSLYETAFGTADTYFEAGITLLFFLLIGRTLDHYTRERARGAVAELARLAPRTARRVEAGGLATVAIDEIAAGDIVEIASGERVPADAVLAPADGRCFAFDRSLVNGETEPAFAGAGEAVLAGTLALDGPVRLVIERPAEESFLADMRRLMAAAEDVRSPQMRIAERAARLYAPVVHLVAIFACIGWLIAGASAYTAISIAIVVLIITCPCALALAVPAVQVVASDVLFRRGVALKDGAALERIRETTRVVFDKTGTLTIPAVANAGAIAQDDLAIAAALARHSSHPAARAVAEAARSRGLSLPATTLVREEKGQGVAAMVGGLAVRLGRSGWAEAVSDGAGSPERIPGTTDSEANGPRLVLAISGRSPVPIALTEALRPGADTVVAALKGEGLPITILSGDRSAPVGAVAARLGVTDWRSGVTPAQKLAVLEAMAAAGDKVLMVGDGINDGPALAAAHASMSPAEGADISRAAADLVMMSASLEPVWSARRVAIAAHRHVVQNLAIALGYNVVAIPLACAGYITPLLAALAMSSSSILVTLNALRLRWCVPAPSPSGQFQSSVAANAEPLRRSAARSAAAPNTASAGV